jgi:predicted kinase
MQAVIFIWAQAVGKSTFYQQYFSHSHLRINLDMLRSRPREKRLVELCCELGQRFVVDNTNPSADERARYLVQANAARMECIGYYFSSRMAELLTRNRQRPIARQVPGKAIGGTLSRLQLPEFSEGFDKLYYVRLEAERGFTVEPWRNEI